MGRASYYDFYVDKPHDADGITESSLESFCSGPEPASCESEIRTSPMMPRPVYLTTTYVALILHNFPPRLVSRLL
jgi:hypothetical protein